MTFFRPNPFMPSTPFTDPLYFMRPALDAMVRATEFPAQPPVPKGTPIAIKTEVSDPGLKVSTGPMSMTISGTAQGGVEVGEGTLTGVAFGTYHKSRGIRLTLDIDRAPTTTRTGETSYREKNERLWYVGASKGASAEKIAGQLARQVNERNDFKAQVKTNADGSATINFSRR